MTDDLESSEGWKFWRDYEGEPPKKKKIKRPVMELEKFEKALQNPHLLQAAPALASVTADQLNALWFAVMTKPTPEPLSKEACFALGVAIGAGVVVDKLTEDL